MPTFEEVKQWGVEKLLEWIRQLEPKVLPDDKVENFRKENISGRAFLTQADNPKFFRKEFKLSIGNSLELADLAREIKEGKAQKGKSTDHVPLLFSLH